MSRAQTFAQEHARLSEQTAQNFDTKVAKRIGELQRVTSSFEEYQNATNALSELQALLNDANEDKELQELATEDIIVLASQLESIERKLATALLPKHPFEDLGCLLEIRPGAGGGEANLFAGDLLRMYRNLCSRKGFRASLLKYENADGTSDASGEAPLAEAILEVESTGAYGQLRCEAGVHRVQRVPATESKGRTHTSAVSVLILPSFPSSSNGDETLTESDFNDPTSDYYVNPQDVRTDVMRARGAGGQHVNTTDSAIRLTHIPTNTVVSMQDSRSQHKNRADAWSLLRSRLAQARREAREEEMMQMRRSVVGVARMGRGDKVRTYNWGQQRVTDHRSGLSVHNLDNVMEGGDELDKVMESVRSWMSERELEDMIAEEDSQQNKK